MVWESSEVGVTQGILLHSSVTQLLCSLLQGGIDPFPPVFMDTRVLAQTPTKEKWNRIIAPAGKRSSFPLAPRLSNHGPARRDLMPVALNVCTHHPSEAKRSTLDQTETTTSPTNLHDWMSTLVPF